MQKNRITVDLLGGFDRLYGKFRVESEKSQRVATGGWEGKRVGGIVTGFMGEASGRSR